jgi:hypothetical protein
MNITKVLATRYGGAGDMIMMEPVLEALYYKFRPAEIYLRTHPHYADLHQFHPLLQKIVPGILTANSSAPGIPSDEKKPQGFDYFYNTTGCVEMNRGIHGIDSFAFATSAIPFRRTPVLYLDPDVSVEPRDIVVHTPKRSDRSPRNNDFRIYDIPEMISKHLDKEGVKYDSITAIGENEERAEGLQEFSRVIAGAKLFVGPDSAGSHIAAALSVPHVTAYTEDFPRGIRAYPNTIAVRDNDLAGLLRAVTRAYTGLGQPFPDPVAQLCHMTQKYAYRRTCGPEVEANQSGYQLIEKVQLTFDENWRHKVWELVERLETGGVLFLYEAHPRFGGAEDPLRVAKYLIQTCGLDILEYSATADAYGHFFIEAQKVERPKGQF